MNCQNGSCSLRRTNSTSGLFAAQAAPLMNMNFQGAAFQKFGNTSFNRLQGMQAFNPQMFSNMNMNMNMRPF